MKLEAVLPRTKNADSEIYSEPLRELFKDEGNAPQYRFNNGRLTSEQVRELGTKLGIPEALVFRHPFPVNSYSRQRPKEAVLTQIPA